MSTGVHQPASPKSPDVADTGATIQIEHLPDHAVAIRVTFPPEQRKRSAKSLFITCCVLAVAMIAAPIFVRAGLVSWFVLIAIYTLVIYFMAMTIRVFLAVTRSYIIQASRTGLTFETIAGKNHTTEHFTRGQVIDITLGFSFYRGPNSTFSCWMLIATSNLGEIECLQNLGGDHLARIANALREALGMPARSWP
jgi:hypothetical protein